MGASPLRRLLSHWVGLTIREPGSRGYPLGQLPSAHHILRSDMKVANTFVIIVWSAHSPLNGDFKNVSRRKYVQAAGREAKDKSCTEYVLHLLLFDTDILLRCKRPSIWFGFQQEVRGVRGPHYLASSTTERRRRRQGEETLSKKEIWIKLPPPHLAFHARWAGIKT